MTLDKEISYGMTPFHNAVTFHTSTSEVLTKIARFHDFFQHRYSVGGYLAISLVPQYYKTLRIPKQHRKHTIIQEYTKTDPPSLPWIPLGRKTKCEKA